MRYRDALENPPILVVCDLDRFVVRTNFTNTPTVVHEFSLSDLRDRPKEPLRVLQAVMQHPDELRPGKTRDELTAEAAQQFASLAELLRGRDHEPQAVAHFLNKLLFCMFAEDSGLLPHGLMRRLAKVAKDNPATFTAGLSELFSKMSHEGGLFGADQIQWFNGGLFDGGEVLPLTRDEIALLAGTIPSTRTRCSTVSSHSTSAARQQSREWQREPLEIVREVHDEWAAAGKLTHPDDGDGRDDDNLAFFEEVEHRLAEAEDRKRDDEEGLLLLGG